VKHSIPAMRFALALVAIALMGSLPLHADPRPPEPLDAAGLRLAIERLNVVGTALYVGAHPDDENTACLAWLSKGRMVRTAYLSLTRGDGGQNLIGPDIGERLGVIRTQELLAARRIAGGEQYFARALDFGYSKNPEETLAKWGHDRILADVVWVIRSLEPDVIITRFPTDGSGGHGHHTASAILAEEAFAAAADSTRFPDQLGRVRTWRATRLVWNAFRFGQQGPDTTRGRLHVDLGEYQPLLGRSFTEIGGEGRSMHKSQGFGAAERRGAWDNTFAHRLGAPATSDLFDGVNLGWSRVPGAAPLTPLFAKAAREFDPEHPERAVPTLLEAYDRMRKLEDTPIVRRKRIELNDAIRACSGLWLEAVATQHTASPGSRVRVVVTALVRSGIETRLPGVALRTSHAAGTGAAPQQAERTLGWTLARNQPRSDTLLVALPHDMPTSEPYWLSERPLPGSFELRDPSAIGRAENEPALLARFAVAIGGRTLTFEVPVVYRWIDPVQGERYRDLCVVPPAALRFDHGVYLFPDARPRELRVTVQSADQPVRGALELRLPGGWRAEPPRVSLALPGGEADTTVSFRVMPGPASDGAIVSARFETEDGTRCEAQRVRLDYPHIPIQTLLPPAEAHLVRAEVRHRGSTVGYVMGSGDQVPEALQQMGYRVTALGDESLEREELSRFDAIVIGVRAYNTRPRLRALVPRLLAYAAGGGRLVTQYQTPDPALDDRLGPFPFKVSSDRVTVEEAEMRPLLPAHALLTTPNRITPADFAGWVQERGLWYARPWDPRYQTVLSANDPGEPARDGGVLYARIGKGAFIYTGLAFFRQLPAGVPGAYRLFANLVSGEIAR
jgi:LmbE family N-acetylglucosaminyl deacetylase